MVFALYSDGKDTSVSLPLWSFSYADGNTVDPKNPFSNGITDGKYHQIKRMIHSIDNDVKELHRLSIGSLKLDESLMFGQSRPMTQEEVGLLYG